VAVSGHFDLHLPLRSLDRIDHPGGDVLTVTLLTCRSFRGEDEERAAKKTAPADE
jgi:hypothetical protein